MADRLTIVLANEAELTRRLGRMIQRLERPRELLDRIGAALEQNIEFRFDTKQDPDGTAWKPLAPSTRKAYLAKYDGNIPGSLLERTRRMRDSLTHNATDAYVDVGFGDPVAGYHETGTRRMPRRGLLTDDPVAGTLGDQDREDVLALMNAFLQDL